MTSHSAGDPEIAVIVVNYGTAELTAEAVQSVLSRKNGGRCVEVHVVDNASPGDDAARLREAHGTRGWGDRVTIHAERVNHGFGRGNNVVLRMLAARLRPPEKVFLLNPDARLANETLDILATFMDEHPDVAAAGAAILHPDGRPATAAFRFPTLLGEFEKMINFGPVSRLLGRWRISLPPDQPAGAVDWVSGAAVMFRFAPVQRAGFFDPSYFLYYEEVDLMLALSRAGWQTWFVPKAQVIHDEGAATGVSPESGRGRRPAFVYESWRIYFAKNHGRGYAIATAVLSLLAALLSRGISVLRRQRAWVPVDYVRDQVRLVLLPLIAQRGARAQNA